jgi:hypothetical protein
MNNFLSPVVLIFFVFSEAMMCLSTFQLALVSASSFAYSAPTNVKYVPMEPLLAGWVISCFMMLN